MEAYAQALTFAIPGFLVLMLVEYGASLVMKKEIGTELDTISSLSSGMTNTLKSLVGLSVVILGYGWMVAHLDMGLLSFESQWPWYLLAWVGIDFASYWTHRWNHSINLFWNRHIIHHSSEEYNLACALRQEVSAIVGIYFFLSVPMALLGVPAEVIGITAPIHLFAQFWYHTKLIDKMGIFEHILMTPSHHRVHHAINPEYIDKNFSAIFIVWDKWFGTFQEELPDVAITYGTLKQANTWNPIWINYQHAWQLAKDAWHADSWWDKVRIWFMPTGWRPKDVAEQFPIKLLPITRSKYQSHGTRAFKSWAWVQLAINNILLTYMLMQFGQGEMAKEAVLIYSLFMLLSIMAYTSLMDRSRIAVPLELAKFGVFSWIMYTYRGWFGMNELVPFGTQIVLAYVLISLGATLYFTFFGRVNEELAL